MTTVMGRGNLAHSERDGDQGAVVSQLVLSGVCSGCRHMDHRCSYASGRAVGTRSIVDI